MGSNPTLSASFGHAPMRVSPNLRGWLTWKDGRGRFLLCLLAGLLAETWQLLGPRWWSRSRAALSPKLGLLAIVSIFLCLGAAGVALLGVAFDERELPFFPGVPDRTVRITAICFGCVLCLPLLPWVVSLVLFVSTMLASSLR